MFFVLDLETDEWSLEKVKKDYTQTLNIRFGVIRQYDSDGNPEIYKIFTELTDLENWLIERYYEPEKKKDRRQLRIYIHNIDFDFLFMFEYWISKGYKLHPVKNQQFMRFSCEKDGKYLFDFRNSLSLLPSSIEKLGKAIGLPKLKADFSSSNESLHEYCIRDCDIVAKALVYMKDVLSKFNLEKKVERFNLTLPALSMNLFLEHQKEYDDVVISQGKPKKINRLVFLHDYINKAFREFYFGGRTEVFNAAYASNLKYYDINSLYPSVMIQNRFPMPPYFRCTDCTIQKDTFAVFCEIDESDEFYPLIPERINGKCVFRACKKKALITIEEYNYLNERKVPIQILHSWICFEWGFPFAFLSDIYHERVNMKNAKNPAELFLKLIMNSIYGKFAEKMEKNELLYVKLNENEKIGNQIEYYQNLGYKIDVLPNNGMLLLHKKDKNKFTRQNLIFAHRITALARLKLTQHMHTLQAKNIDIYYCDTDSIVCKPNEVLPISEDLGAFKIEIDEIEQFLALSAKEYWIKTPTMNISKMKGVSRGNLIDYYRCGIENCKVMKLTEALNRGIIPHSAIYINKNKRTFYDKRKILCDGTTQPLKIYDNMHTVMLENGMYVAELLELPVKQQLKRKQLREYYGSKFTTQKRIEQTLIENEEMYAENETISDLYDDKLTADENLDRIRNNFKDFSRYR